VGFVWVYVREVFFSKVGLPSLNAHPSFNLCSAPLPDTTAVRSNLNITTTATRNHCKMSDSQTQLDYLAMMAKYQLDSSVCRKIEYRSPLHVHLTE
jgi:hypothetical protein